MKKEELFSVLEYEITIIDFWAEWCAPCRIISPILDQLEKENENVSLIKLNVEDEENKVLISEFDIKSIPAILIVNKEGVVLHRFSGNRPKGAIQELLNSVL